MRERLSCCLGSGPAIPFPPGDDGDGHPERMSEAPTCSAQPPRELAGP